MVLRAVTDRAGHEKCRQSESVVNVADEYDRLDLVELSGISVVVSLVD